MKALPAQPSVPSSGEPVTPRPEVRAHGAVNGVEFLGLSG